jgi:hypothetical protein
MDSRLLDRAALTSPKLAKALENAMPKLNNAMLRGHLVSGAKVHSVGISDTAVHPAWRKAYVHIIGTGVGVPNIGALKELAADTAAYSNEVSNPFKYALYLNTHANDSAPGARRTGSRHSGVQTTSACQPSNRK